MPDPRLYSRMPCTGGRSVVRCERLIEQTVSE